MPGPEQDLPDDKAPDNQHHARARNTNWADTDTQRDYTSQEDLPLKDDSLFGDLSSIEDTQKTLDEYTKRLQRLGGFPNYQQLATDSEDPEVTLRRIKELIIYDRLVRAMKHRDARQDLEIEEKKLHLTLKRVGFYFVLIFIVVVLLVVIYVVITQGALSESGAWEGLFNLIKATLEIIFTAGKDPNFQSGY